MPFSSRSMVDLTEIQRVSPSLGRMIRYCTLYSRTSPATASRNFLSVASRSSGWMRRTQSSCDSLAASGGSPWISRYSGDRRLRKPVRQIDFKPADPADLLHPRQFGLAFPQRRGGEIILGHVAADHQHAADAVILVDRAVAVGPVDLLQPAVPRHRNELVLMPGRAAAAHHLLDLRTDDGPDFSPAFPPALTERARVALGSHGLAIGVVIELDEFGAPPDEHRVVGVEQDPHRGAQALRPGFGRSQRTCRPVIGRASTRPFPRRRRGNPQKSVC